jgi:hypothetical protein
VTAIGAQLAAKVRLEALRRGDRVVVTIPGREPELMIVNGRARAGASIGDAQITVRPPGRRGARPVTAGQIADGATIERAGDDEPALIGA